MREEKQFWGARAGEGEEQGGGRKSKERGWGERVRGGRLEWKALLHRLLLHWLPLNNRR